ncbi:MAG: hypothetical protein KGO81_13215, partial [Bacteroidota bacterium]|nr:hypothetical protein [Bacteroidota bacterium]
MINKPQYLLLLGLLVLCTNTKLLSQSSTICNSNAIAPVFKQDFGQASSSTSTSQATPGSTNYNFGNVSTDGNYIITPLVDNANKSDWTKGGDHTGNTNGNMFLVNAGGNNSVYFRDTVSNLCQGSTYNFSAWLANVNTSSTLSICGSSYVYANVIFYIKDLSGNILGSVTTGNLPLSPTNGPPNWQQYGFQFSLPSNVSTLVLEMDDYYGGGAQCGNDIALDDILFTACTPQATATINTSAAVVCSGTSTTITSTLTNSPYTTPAYQWQKSTDGGNTWNNVGNASTTSSSLSLSNVSSNDNGLYRVIVGPTIASLSSNSCITASNSVTLTVSASPVVSISTNSPLCEGNTLALNTSVSSGTPSYAYSWSGPNNFTSTSSSLSFPAATTSLSGTYTVTVTDSKTCTGSAVASVVVNPNPVLSPISGNTGGCKGSSFQLTDTAAGGVWSSSNTSVASINSSGLVTINGSGTSTITYSVTNTYGCSSNTSQDISGSYVQLGPDYYYPNCNNATIHFGTSNFPVTYGNNNSSDTYLWTITGEKTGPVNFHHPDETSQYPSVQLGQSDIFHVTVNYTSNGITCTATTTIYKAVPLTVTVSSTSPSPLCNNVNNLALTGTISPNIPGSGVSYAWSTSGNGSFTNQSSLTPTYTFSSSDKISGVTLTLAADVSGSSSSCKLGGQGSLAVTFYPSNTGTNQTTSVCSGTALNFTPTSTVSGSTFTWTSTVISGTISGNSATGTGNITDILTNASTTTSGVVQYTITPSANGCAGTPFTYTVTVNPLPLLSVTNTNNTICSGTNTNITLSSSLTGSTFTWSSSTTGSISGASTQSSSSNNLINDVLTNSGTTAGTVTYSMQAISSNGCPSTIATTAVTVNPLPSITTTLSNAIYCTGTIAPAVTLSGNVAGTSFTWTNDNTAIGLGAAGNGDIPSFTATNTSNAPAMAHITVTPSANGCT